MATRGRGRRRSRTRGNVTTTKVPRPFDQDEEGGVEMERTKVTDYVTPRTGPQPQPPSSEPEPGLLYEGLPRTSSVRTTRTKLQRRD